MKNILVPVGHSANMVSHIQYSIDFASEFGADLYLVQFYELYNKAGTLMKVNDIIQKESLSYLDSLMDQVDQKDVDVNLIAFEGDIVNSLDELCDKLNIDLVMLEPRINSKKETVWLGKTSGKIVKKTNIPSYIVPVDYKYQSIPKILFGLKNATIKKHDALQPLIDIQDKYDSEIDLVLVKTPYYEEGDFDVPEKLQHMVTNTYETENATTFQGILEYYQKINPDLITVVRRKRGAFSKIWEKNTINKKDFYSTVPVLVLSGLK